MRNAKQMSIMILIWADDDDDDDDEWNGNFLNDLEMSSDGSDKWNTASIIISGVMCVPFSLCTSVRILYRAYTCGDSHVHLHFIVWNSDKKN